MTFISYNLLKNENYIHESFVFPTKPNNELHGGKGVFQKESASFVIGVSNLDWVYRVLNCDTGITVGCIVSYPTEASHHWAGKFSKKVNLYATSTLGCKRAGSEELHGSEQT